jgi:hypothetical protein
LSPLEKPYSSSSPIFPFTHVYANTIHTPCHTILFVIKICFTTQQCCSPLSQTSQKQQLTHLQSNTNWQNTTRAITLYPSLQHSSPSTHHPLQSWYHSAYNPSLALSRNPDVTDMPNEIHFYICSSHMFFCCKCTVSRHLDFPFLFLPC